MNNDYDDFDRHTDEISNEERGTRIRRELFRKKYLNTSNASPVNDDECTNSFKMRQILMSMDMIKYHYPHFDELTKKRADKTLSFLENEYGWCQCLMKNPPQPSPSVPAKSIGKI